MRSITSEVNCALRWNNREAIGENSTRLLAYLMERQQHGQGAPSFREMMELTGIRSTNGVANHLLYLARAGLIEVAFGRQRAIQVTCRFVPVEMLDSRD